MNFVLAIKLLTFWITWSHMIMGHKGCTVDQQGSTLAGWMCSSAEAKIERASCPNLAEIRAAIWTMYDV